MASIPASELAREILDGALTDGTWPPRALNALIERALDEQDEFLATAATRALFSIVIERLGDLFDPALCEVYARMFAHVISQALPEYKIDDLLLRYRRIRQVRRFPGGEVRRVFVLSRVTLGADVAVTSVALAAAKKRFPDAEVCLVGPAKNGEMFAADPCITPVAIAYGRSGLLRERLLAAAELRVAVDEQNAIVIDPDSRLTQLGLMPICDDSRYFFFESRAFGGESEQTLPDLAAEWLREVFDVEPSQAYVAPAPQQRVADITVSLGVGHNLDKRLDGDFEYQIFRTLLRYRKAILVDRGAGGEEAARVNALVERLGSPELLQVHDGSYASFASHILQSKLYVGYDSAGQHVAAAGTVPLVCIFTGYPCERMLARWRPTGSGCHVVTVDERNRATALDRTLEAIAAASEEAEGAAWAAQMGPS